jgi:predicted alpha/beta hydrolase
VKFSKCEFAQPSVHYLGHVISSAGVATDDSKISAVRDWPTPTDAKQLRSFLGLAGYYRKFVRNYASISKPLTALLTKFTPYIWTPATDLAFRTLKEALVSAPVLALPDFAAQFTIETDACEYGIGAVLLQKGHPLAFVSKSLGPRNRGLSTYEKEYMAILLAVQQWR